MKKLQLALTLLMGIHLLPIVAFAQTGPFATGGNVAYRLDTEDDHIKLGDQFAVNLDLADVLLPGKSPGRNSILVLETTYLPASGA